MANRRKVLRSSDPGFLRDTAANFRDMTARLRQPEIVSTLGQLADILEARAQMLNGDAPLSSARGSEAREQAYRPK